MEIYKAFFRLTVFCYTDTMTVLIEPEKEKQLDGGFKEKKTERAEKFNKGIEKILITILR